MPRKRSKTTSALASSRKKQKNAVIEDIELEELGDYSIDEIGAALASSPSKGSEHGARRLNNVGSERKASLTSCSQTQASTGNNAVDNEDEDNDDDDDDDRLEPRFIGEPVDDEEARTRWPHRYEEKQQMKGRNSSNSGDQENIIKAKRHYLEAEVDGRVVYKLYNDAHVQGEAGKDCYICRIVEIFEGVDGVPYFTAQWYYRATDTVLKDVYPLDNKRVFFSEVRDDNPLDCLVEKVNIARVPLNVDLEYKRQSIPNCTYYCDVHYLLPYSSFTNLPVVGSHGGDSLSTVSSVGAKSVTDENFTTEECSKPEVTLLDLYSGCGAMSTGLCLGANLGGVNLVTKWAVDINENACESLKLNHPETEVRNEPVEDFLMLLKEWEKLCIRFSVIKSDDPEKNQLYPFDNDDGNEDDEDEEKESEDDIDPDTFEVDRITSICYGDPKKNGKTGLHFKVKWKNYGPEYDTWEPIDGLGNCRESIGEFVKIGYRRKILPLPGDVDVICGGPPCQGISGFNRFRNRENPLADEKNRQLIIFMDVVKYLLPRFVLMENVVDLLKFAGGHLGRYASSRLIEMNYQTRIGMMAAGAYGLPQFRMRVFLWGARPTEKLPQYPLPTHDVVVRGVVPVEFEANTVAYDENTVVQLERKLVLEDAISDLPPVGNDEQRDEIPYDKDPQTDFQRLIRLSKEELFRNVLSTEPLNRMLFDHRPLKLNDDDHQRVCRVPKSKGANFRDFPGVRVRSDNKVEWDPDVERVKLDSGKPLVPDYAMTFVGGTSSKPFGRLWWDETVPTVVTRAEPHNQAIVHPEQDRVLTIRENARLQGFPDYYKLCGDVKQRYVQVGNAVAVPVSRALGYALAMAFQGTAGDEPVFRLPARFPNMHEPHSPVSSENES